MDKFYEQIDFIIIMYVIIPFTEAEAAKAIKININNNSNINDNFIFVAPKL